MVECSANLFRWPNSAHCGLPMAGFSAIARLPVAGFSASSDRPLAEFSVNRWGDEQIGQSFRPSGGRFQRITDITGRHKAPRKAPVVEFSANATREAHGQRVYIEMIIGSEANRKKPPF